MPGANKKDKKGKNSKKNAHLDKFFDSDKLSNASLRNSMELSAN